MFRNLYHTLYLPLLCVLFVACTTNYFDEEEYEKRMYQQYPVEDIEEGHQWDLVGEGVLRIDLGATASDIAELQILSANPLTMFSTKIFARKAVNGKGGVHELMYEYPLTQRSVYVACVTTDGLYYVRETVSGNRTLDFSQASAAAKQKPKDTPQDYNYTYCFEDCFPGIGDFDFNDLVLNVTPSRPDDTTLQLDVKIAAVGTQNMMGAALHLVGITEQDIDFVTVENPFEQIFDDFNAQIIPRANKQGFAKSIQDTPEVVVPLFNDAHYAISRGAAKDQESEIVKRAYYNTWHSTNENRKRITDVPVATFTIKLKSVEAARRLTMHNLDVFIVTSYNGSWWEIHTRPYKTTQTLHKFIAKKGNYQSDHSWAFLIPGTFRYPLEGWIIGTQRSNRLGGVYNIIGHSFGEWGTNSMTALDWYNYPNARYVY